jgi:hypothetical protein
MKILTIYLFFILICFSFIGFKSIKVTAYPITQNEVFIKNKTFQNLILNSKNNFTEKFKYQPKAITIEFYNDQENNKFVKIFAHSFLYINEDDKKVFDYKFVGAFTSDSTTVLIKNNPEFSFSLFEIKKSKKEVQIFYGNRIDFCEDKFRIEVPNTFVLKKRLWSYELETD